MLDTLGVSECVKSFYAKLSKLNSPILYAANVDPRSLARSQKRRAPRLDIVEKAGLSDAKSLIDLLGGGRHAGIVRPLCTSERRARRSSAIGRTSASRPSTCTWPGHQRFGTCIFILFFSFVRLSFLFFCRSSHYFSPFPFIIFPPRFVVPPRYAQAFSNLLVKLGLRGPDRNCGTVLQHKFHFVDPLVVLEHKIPVHTVIIRSRFSIFRIFFNFRRNKVSCFHILSCHFLIHRSFSSPATSCTCIVTIFISGSILDGT